MNFFKSSMTYTKTNHKKFSTKTSHFFLFLVQKYIGVMIRAHDLLIGNI